MTKEIDFDALSRRATETDAIEDLNELFGNTFALHEWHFILRGELPNVYPYIASNAQYADNQPMIRAFTDTKRLQRFARENNLTDAEGNASILTIPTANIVKYLEAFIPQGAYGVWFNSDMASDGFFIPIKQLQPIKDHLAKINRQKKDAPKEQVETLQLIFKEGLMLPSGEIKTAPYTSNVFWRVPTDWLENGKIKAEHLWTFEKELSGGKSETIEGAFYVPVDYSVKIFSPEDIKTTDWRTIKDNSDDSCTFFIISETGEVRFVSAEEFQSDVALSFQPTAKEIVSPPPPSNNLASYGLYENADGEIGQLLMIDGEQVEVVRQTEEEQQTPQTDAEKAGSNDSPVGEPEEIITVNRAGSVDFGAEIIPMSGDIITMIEDYSGSGEYVTLLRFEPQGISQMTEKIAENSHGACLQIRTFYYLNPKNGVHIGVDSVHSNELHHVRTGSKLLLSLELCKNLDNQTAAFYFALQGAESDVAKLWDLIELYIYTYGFELFSQ